MNNMSEQQLKLKFDNSTRLPSLSLPSSSLTPMRTRTVINVIYISGIVFMIIVFLTLLWINLYSRRCWCWHDTPLINRFYREWLIRHSMRRDTDMSLSKHQRRAKISNDNELLA